MICLHCGKDQEEGHLRGGLCLIYSDALERAQLIRADPSALEREREFIKMVES